LNVQLGILETFVDRGQLRKLAEPTITSTGKRIPGFELDHPRQLALIQLVQGRATAEDVSIRLDCVGATKPPQQGGKPMNEFELKTVRGPKLPTIERSNAR
jgi:hypothetical protein